MPIGRRCQLLASATALLALLHLPPSTLSAQTEPKRPTPRKGAAAQDTSKTPASQDAPKGPTPFDALKFRNVGPAAGGRVSRAVGVPGDPLTYYAATASGGVWKSVDGGLRWQSIFDDQPISSIGSIAVAPSDPNVIYVGSGEANIRGNVAAGNGIYKSVDGGKTWTHVWKQEGQIGTMVVHPKNPDIAYAAVLGHAFGPNPERGVYRTKDGGKTWQQILKKDPDTGASDVELDPSNPNIVFAGLWQARRRPWEMTSGGPGSGLYMSRDGGDTWKQLTGKGLPAGIWGKIGVRVAPSDGRRVYALIEAEEGGLFRSDNGGESWERVSGHHALRQRAWYYTTLTVDPTNPNVVWFPQVPLLKTIDGGKTITYVKGAHHGDHHDIWIDPTNPRRMIGSNDGGVDLTSDGGEHWFAPPLPISQFYHVAVDNSTPYRLSGAMQDLGTAGGPSNSLSRSGNAREEWHDVGGGEAGHTAYDPSDPNIIYAGEYFGIITHYDERTRQARHVGAYPENPSGHGVEDAEYRFQWTAPIATGLHDPKVVYHGAQVLFKSTDAGQSWTAISPDLTRNDKSKQKWSGGPISGDNTGVEFYSTIFAIAESPKEPGLIWAGSDDGLVHITRDGGKSWTNVTKNIPGFPEWGTVSLIEASPFDAGTAYLVVDAHRLDDMKPYLWKTSDYGKSWKRLGANLPQDVYLHAVREDPKRRGLLYVGTERGVVYSTDDGATFQPLKLGLPTVAVHDLRVKDNDLVLATHGRSLWIFDDLTPIREMSPKVAADNAYLFAPQPAIRWRYHRGPRGLANGENPPEGAIIYYHLKQKPKDEVRLEILDQQGTVIRTLRSTAKPAEFAEDDPDEPTSEPKPALSTEPGVQRAVWDLTYEGTDRIPNAKLDSGDPTEGPMAIPGRYTARLVVDGKTYTQPLVINPDPRVKVSQEDLAAQLKFGLEIRDQIKRLVDAVADVRGLRAQLAARTDMWKADTKAAPLVSSAQKLSVKLDSLEAKLHNPRAEVAYDVLMQRGGAKLYSRITPLYGWVIEADGAPTQGAKSVFANQVKELDGLVAEFRGLVGSDLAALNKQARDLGLADVSVPARAAETAAAAR
ncbi:MAG TPA: glycosyl hydrolase [Gemmatimonadales bacterium]|nr:glycosyl hydrolase [Gemmatimonadales bacterium]